MKIDCHEMASVSSPPATGPSAAPATPAPAQRAAPRGSEPVAATSSSRQAAMTTAPPSACAMRAASSASSDGAIAQPAQAVANTTSPAAPSAPGSRRTHSRAAGTAARASTRLKAVSTHDTCPTVVPYSRRMSGSASVTTAESARTTPTASDRVMTAALTACRVSVGALAAQCRDEPAVAGHRAAQAAVEAARLTAGGGLGGVGPPRLVGQLALEPRVRALEPLDPLLHPGSSLGSGSLFTAPPIAKPIASSATMPSTWATTTRGRSRRAATRRAAPPRPAPAA